MSPEERSRRPDARERTRRDLERRHRREERGDTFWRSLTLAGSVGWPIVLLAIGGTLLGRYLDQLWDTAPLVTVALLVLGTLVGSLIAYLTVRRAP